MASAAVGPLPRTLVLGGARSGKSSHAESLIASDAAVAYVATGRRNPDDLDWEARIEQHRIRRPSSWTTHETTDLATELDRPFSGTRLVDDLGTWLTSVLDDAHAWDLPRGSVAAHTDGLVDAVASCRSRLILVSPEVGLSVIPESRSGRLFRDEIGALNSRLAEVCNEVVLVVAGLPLILKTGTKGTL